MFLLRYLFKTIFWALIVKVLGRFLPLIGRLARLVLR